MTTAKPAIGASACLLGHPVRYDGTHKLDPYIASALVRHFHIIPVCPETECGMPVPREPMELSGPKEKPRLVGRQSGTDLSGRMLSWIPGRLDALGAEQLSGFVFKARSPSCACAGRMGLFAGTFIKRFPLLAVIDAEALRDAAQRESFLSRALAYHRWLGLQAGGLTKQKLISFHSAHKLLLMAHSITHYRALGRLISNIRDGGRLKGQEYIGAMMHALSLPATPGKHANALAHAGGYFRRVLSRDERAELKELAEAVRSGEMPVTGAVTLINHYVRKYGESYLAGQIYLNPHPVETAGYR